MLDRLNSATRIPAAGLSYRTPLVDRLNAIVIAAHLGRGQASQKDPSGVTRDTRMVLPMNPWKMRVKLSADQTTTDHNKTVVNFGTVDYDHVNGFSTSSHTYTVSTAGYWVIEITLAVGVPSV